MRDFFSLGRVFEYFPLILSKLPVTLSIVGISMLLGLVLGTLIAMVRINRIPVLREAAAILVSFLRGTPIIVQLFIVYFALPLALKAVGIDAARWNKLIFVNATYGLNTAAFVSEIVRGAINGVEPGQWEAAYSVGLTRFQTFKRIVAPQALLIALPSFSVVVLNLLQNTSLGFTVGLLDMIGQVRSIGVRTFHVMEGYVGAAFVFVVLSILINRFFGIVEDRLKAKMLKTEGKG
jgi:L-cystine transport system permease protein